MGEHRTGKRAVSLFFESDLLDEARRLDIDLSETLERRLRVIVNAGHENRWLEENRAALSSINAFIDEHGLPASKLRYRADKE